MSDPLAEREPDRRVVLTTSLAAAAGADDLPSRAFHVARARRAVDAMRAEIEQLDAFVRAEEAEIRRRREGRA